MSQEGPDVIGPDTHPKKNLAYYTKIVKRTFTTREGLIGYYDYAFLFKPNLPFMGASNVTPPFFGLHGERFRFNQENWNSADVR
jgi:hypothetical protein